MKKIYLAASWILFFCASLIFNNTAMAKIYIDIDSPNFQQFPIAVCDYNDLSIHHAESAGIGSTLADEIKKYLAMTGIFNILNKNSFLEEKKTVNAITLENIRFPDWAAIGADYLLRGNIITRNDRDIIIENRLYDVTRGELLFGKKYNAKINEPKAVARMVASDILLALTGDEGEFNTKIAFISKKASKSDIYTISYDGSDINNITHHQTIILSPRWSPDGNFLAFTSFKDGQPKVYIRNLKTGTEKKVASFEGLNLCGSFSPDGKKLLLTLSKEDNEEIYVLETETAKLKRLTNDYSIDVSPTWSPDGQKIAFVSNRSGSPQIYTMDAGGDNVKRITYEGNYNTSPSWSPRGGRIAYEGIINGNYQIFSVDEDGNNLLQLTFDAARNESPSWSPSGRQIVYSSKTASKSRICIMNANGLNIRILYENNDILTMPMWSPRFK
jgi:TolB protein